MRALGIVAAAIVGAAAGFAAGYVVGGDLHLYYGALFGAAGAMIFGMTVAHLLPRGRRL